MNIGIIGAMDEEIERMQKDMHIVDEKKIANISFYIGRFENIPIVLCKSGVGKVNAAITTQILIDHFSVEQIIFTGVAGALDPSLNIGDIVISTCCEQHDIDGSALGFKRGVIPMFDGPSIFPADESLIQLAYEAANNLKIECNVVKGKILSGDQFIADPLLVQKLREDFHGTCVEMEGAAVAHVSMLNDIPYVIIRSISDKANKEADVNFTEFVAMAANRSNEIVSSILKHIKNPK